MKKSLYRIFSLLLPVLLLTTASVYAAEPSDMGIQPLSSDYLRKADGFINTTDEGLVRIYFTVTGTEIMDTIGATTITLQQSSNGSSWSTTKIFTSASYPNMLASDKLIYSSYVSYEGSSDMYYRAYITATASKGGGSDLIRFLVT